MYLNCCLIVLTTVCSVSLLVILNLQNLAADTNLMIPYMMGKKCCKSNLEQLQFAVLERHLFISYSRICCFCDSRTYADTHARSSLQRTKTKMLLWTTRKRNVHVLVDVSISVVIEQKYLANKIAIDIFFQIYLISCGQTSHLNYISTNKTTSCSVK